MSSPPLAVANASVPRYACILTPVDITEHPAYRRLAIWHIMAVVLIQATSTTVVTLLPILAAKRFHANEWLVLLITAAPVVFFTLSIFWNDLFKHRTFARYMWIFWAVGCLPLALIAFAQHYWMLLIPHLICSIGGAGYHPAAGELLNRLYPSAMRGRIYSVVWGITLVAGAVIGYGLGRVLEHDEESFRVFLPVIAAFQLVGVLIFSMMGRMKNVDEGRVKISEDRTLYQRVVEPMTHMKEVLKTDPVFARYEAAYMTYGVGWMIAYALLPNIITKKLHLGYDEAALSTQVPYLLGMVVMLWPAGWLMDRLGPVRSTGLSFVMLITYPVGLILAPNAHWLMIVSFIYGLSHAGTSVGWMLGPVSLAPSPEKVPQYVAIHATFVGIRGKIFQFLGVGLYSLLQDFTIPLVLASLAFAWSAYQMWQLHGMIAATRRERELAVLASSPALPTPVSYTHLTLPTNREV